ncbi:MAG TPA: DUF2628 domain-containing protein [Bacillota bacterium]|nr:DUF2628 domain-containing protein [Bacillota bacterium]
MFCSICGERIDADSHFCVHCGHRVSREGAKQPKNHHLREESSNAPSMHNDMDRASGQQGSDPNRFHGTSLYEDMIAYVGQNENYYDQRWQYMEQTSNKRSWNFAAFFLSLFRLGYRRLFKELFMIMGLFIVLDLVLIFSGVRVDVLAYINFGLGLVIWILIGFYGNDLYRSNVEKNVRLMRNVVDTQSEKEALINEKGGPSMGGVFAAIGIFAVYFCIVYYLLFSVFGVVSQVKHGNLYDYPDVTVDEAFNDFFDEGKWKYQKGSSSFKMVEYRGVKKFDGEDYNIKIDFILDDDDEFHFNRIVVDGDELNDYEVQQFIEFVFDDSVGLEYW